MDLIEFEQLQLTNSRCFHLRQNFLPHLKNCYAFNTSPSYEETNSTAIWFEVISSKIFS
jgi:hypothetical protein